MGLKELKQKFFPDSFSDSYMDQDDEILDTMDDSMEAEDDSYGKSKSIPVRPSYQTQERMGVAVASRSSSLEMKVVSPTKYDAVTQIADILLEKKTVLLNLENTNKETAKRLIDFLSGVAYALGGDIQKVADNTFAVTPNNVAVSSENVESDYSADAEEGQYE